MKIIGKVRFLNKADTNMKKTVLSPLCFSGNGSSFLLSGNNDMDVYLTSKGKRKIKKFNLKQTE